jgi:hypothetical protein
MWQFTAPADQAPDPNACAQCSELNEVCHLFMTKPAQCQCFPHHAFVAHQLDLETRFIRRTMAMRESAAALVERKLAKIS